MKAEEKGCQHKRTVVQASRPIGTLRIRSRLCYDCERIIYTREEEFEDEAEGRRALLDAEAARQSAQKKRILEQAEARGKALARSNRGDARAP